MELPQAASTPKSTILYKDNLPLNNSTNNLKLENVSCDRTRGPSPVAIKLSNGTPTIRHPLDSRENSSNSDSLDLPPEKILNEKPETIEHEIKTTDNEVNKTRNLPNQLNTNVLSDSEEDKSLFQAILSPDTQDVRLKKEPPSENKRKLIPIPAEYFMKDSEDSLSSHEDFDDIMSPSIESLDEIDDSILEQLGEPSPIEPLPELSAEEESQESRNWQVCSVGGLDKRIDMKVIDPFKRVLSHGGYINSGSQNAIIVFSACFLPHRGRVDYNYVMDNLFFYVLSTLDQLVMDDYVLVYLHGGASKDTLPKFSWLKRCYQMIDHRLRKNLRHLYITHPTFWLKTVVVMSRPFVSSKFYKKLIYVESLSELFDMLPLEQACIPDRVHHYDRIKQSIQSKRK